MKMGKPHHLARYKLAELESYATDRKSCIQRIHTRKNLCVLPFGMCDLKETIAGMLNRKVGKYDVQLRGIVLDFRNTKVLNTHAMNINDSSELHTEVETDFYVFQPHVGAILKGTVKHISPNQIGVIIYRVFNVAIRLRSRDSPRNVAVEQEICFRVKAFDLENILPFIEGELIGGKDENGDSGISTEEHNGEQERGRKRKASESSSEDDEMPRPIKEDQKPKVLKETDSSSDEEEAEMPRPIIKKESPMTASGVSKRVSFREKTPPPPKKGKKLANPNTSNQSPLATPPVRVKTEPESDAARRRKRKRHPSDLDKSIEDIIKAAEVKSEPESDLDRGKVKRRKLDVSSTFACPSTSATPHSKIKPEPESDVERGRRGKKRQKDLLDASISAIFDSSQEFDSSNIMTSTQIKVEPDSERKKKKKQRETDNLGNAVLAAIEEVLSESSINSHSQQDQKVKKKKKQKIHRESLDKTIEEVFSAI